MEASRTEVAKGTRWTVAWDNSAYRHVSSSEPFDEPDWDRIGIVPENCRPSVDLCLKCVLWVLLIQEEPKEPKTLLETYSKGGSE